MKTYLNADEMNDLLFMFHLLEINYETVENWVKRKNMTAEEAKWLRTSITYTKKAMQSILERQDQKERAKFAKRTVKANQQPIRIIDAWMHNRILGTYETEFDIVKIERPSFEKLSLACIQAHCMDCEEHFSMCDIYEVLDDNLMKRAECKSNCPFAYHSKKKLEELRAIKAEKEEKKRNKKVSKRKQKKIQNRFDEE